MYRDRYERRMYRRMNRPQNPLRALAGAIFILFLFLAFLVSNGGFFLPLFFAGLAIALVIASVSSYRAWGIHGGLIGGSWLLGLALCVVLGFWPWILLPIALTLLLGVSFRPIMGGLTGGALLVQNQPPQPAAGDASNQAPSAPSQH